MSEFLPNPEQLATEFIRRVRDRYVAEISDLKSRIASRDAECEALARNQGDARYVVRQLAKQWNDFEYARSREAV